MTDSHRQCSGIIARMRNYDETRPELHPRSFWSEATSSIMPRFYSSSTSPSSNRPRIPLTLLRNGSGDAWIMFSKATLQNFPISRLTKSKGIFRDLHKKTKQYQQLRKVRAFTSKVQHAGEHPRRRVDGCEPSQMFDEHLILGDRAMWAKSPWCYHQGSNT